MISIELRNCNLYLLDATGSNFIVVRIGEGALNYNVKKDIQQRKSRGNLWQLREGEEQPMDISFQFVWDFITSSDFDPPTIEEVLMGKAPGWVSSSIANDPNAPFTVNLQLVNAVPCYGLNRSVITETHNFADFAYNELAHSEKDSVVDCKGISNRTVPTIVRS